MKTQDTIPAGECILRNFPPGGLRSHFMALAEYHVLSIQLLRSAALRFIIDELERNATIESASALSGWLKSHGSSADSSQQQHYTEAFCEAWRIVETENKWSKPRIDTDSIRGSRR